MLGSLVVRILTGEAGVMFARLRTVAVLYALMAVAALCAAIFLLLALFFWVASHLGPIWAALAFAGGFVVVIGLLYVALAATRRPKETDRQERLRRDVASIAGVAAMSNLPVILRSARRQKRLLAIPVAAIGLWGAVRMAIYYRRR